jgi:hypothetical protein
MAILKGDVKLVKSAVMDDVPEGGGPPTANPVVDGASNQIFPDVSEVDRAAGRLSARKVHVWVQSNDTDTYLGGNVIVAEPPNDPNVSITIFSTGQTFDTRADVMPRIEAYLSVGTNYAGYLFGNHIEGQASVALLQRTNELPPIGGSLALTRYEGGVNEFRQYVRVTRASAVERTFTDSGGDYTRFEVSLELSDPLRADFPGFDALRIDPNNAAMVAKTRASNVLVADAARYYGVTPLAEEAVIGDFSVKGESVFTQLVPSAQIETPIGDARTNQLYAGLVPGGAAVTRTLTLAFTTSQSLFIGGAIAPGSLSITAGAVTLTDAGGKLMNAGSQVGLVDYENGVLSLTTNIFGTGGTTFTVVYAPAQVPDAVSQSQGFAVTISSRSISYVRTIEPPPLRASLSVSYRVNERWYVLREDGSGAIRGSESGYGSGSLNFTTGTVQLTLGALPDVGSEVIYQWVEPQAARAADELQLDNSGKLYWPINTAGDVTLDAGPDAIEPNGLTITWNDGTARTATDNGAGGITGDATGTVNYARGVVRLSPNVLPPVGTPISLTLDTSTKTTGSVTVAAGSGSFGTTNITPGSIDMLVTGQFKGQKGASAIVDWGAAQPIRIADNGAGALQADFPSGRVTVGTVNYTAGTFTLAAGTNIGDAQAAQMTAFDNIYVANHGNFAMGSA